MTRDGQKLQQGEMYCPSGSEVNLDVQVYTYSVLRRGWDFVGIGL